MSQNIFAKQTMEALEALRVADIDHATRLFQTARQYAMSGIFVVPIEANSKKLPTKDMGVSYQQATCDLQTIEKWFNPETGTFKGGNIGIACGREGGIFAVDCDKHGHGDGVAKYEAMLKENGNLHTGPIQATPSGGKHYLYQWRENATSSTGKIEIGIDTRGGDRATCRSHIVAFPSIINGKQYVWEHWGPLGEIPKFVADKMGVAWKAQPAGLPEEILEGENEPRLTVPQMESLLRFIDPNKLGYEDWVKVGQAINSQLPDEAGLKLWDTWSRLGKRYKEKECYVRWHGFNPMGPVKAGTLIFFAQQEGWTPPEDWPKIDRLGQYVEEINREFALVKMGDEYKVLWDHNKKDPIKPPYEFFTKDSFIMHTADRKIMLMTTKGPKEIPIAKVWLNHPARRMYEGGIDMLPNGSKTGVFNTWGGWTVEPKEGDCSVFIDHIKEVICAGNISYAEWVLDWMADAIQYPEDPKGVALVLRGMEGTGKGMFACGFGALFGYHFKHLQTDEPLVGRFNSHLADSLLIFADEILWGGNRKAAGRLKTIVTERHLSIERKGLDMETYTNLMRLIIASNEEWVIPAGPESRRWFVLDVSGHRRKDFEYFAKVDAFIKGDGLTHLLHMLMNRKIINNLRNAPETKALMYQRALHASQDTMGLWLNHLLESGEYKRLYDKYKFETKDLVGNVKSGSRIEKHELFAHYTEWSRQNKMHLIIAAAFWTKMRNQYGFDQEMRSRDEDGTRKRTVVMPTVDDITSKYEITYGLSRSNEDDELKS